MQIKTDVVSNEKRLKQQLKDEKEISSRAMERANKMQAEYDQKSK